MAALALLLIVGGALAAGLLAMRMDSRETVLVAQVDIEPGTRITAELLGEAQVASDSLQTIDASLASEVVGAYATTTIRADSLVEERDLSRDAPVGGGQAIVAVNLNPALTPSSELEAGDLVQVVRVNGGNSADGEVQQISTALVLSISRASSDELGGTRTASANLLVPEEAAGAVIDASSADLAGLALLERGQSTDVSLEAAR